MKKIIFIFFGFLVFSFLPLSAVIISSVRIAYVDIEKVFEGLNVVEESRNELRELIEDKKKEIEKLEKVIAAVRNIILLQQYNLPPSAIDDFKNMLDAKEKKLGKLVNESKEFVAGKEKEYKYKILGRIYDTIQKIAMDEGYTIILEKELILFSRNESVDITAEVIKVINENE